MKLLVLLSSVLIAQARYTSNNNKCQDGVYINDIYHDKITLTSGLDRPYLLTVDFDTNTLYFNYNIAWSTYKFARLNLNTREFKNIEGIPNGFASAIDEVNKVIYIGTGDGIYAYNYHTDSTEFYGARGVDIWSLLLKDGVLYYTTYPASELYAFTNGVPTKVKELQDSKVHNFLLDNDYDMTFDNATGLFTLRKGEEHARRYDKSFEVLHLRALTMDLHGKIYAGFKDGIFSVDKDEIKLRKLLNPMDDSTYFGLTFDHQNNMIYSDAHKIVKLVPNKDANC